jgi:S-adenosylmethionine decarboxylase
MGTWRRAMAKLGRRLHAGRIRAAQSMTGIEWIVDAYGCSPELLRDLATLQRLFARLVIELDLHPCGDGQWHQFGESGGITGLSVLSESHLACHSFPEYGTLCLNLFCCRPRADFDFSDHLRQSVGATNVHVRRLERRFSQFPDARQRHETLHESARDD